MPIMVMTGKYLPLFLCRHLLISMEYFRYIDCILDFIFLIQMYFLVQIYNFLT